MKKFLLALLLLLAPAAVSAQCNGVFPNNTICGNVSGSSKVPRPVSNSVLTGVPGGTNGQVQYNNSGVFGGATITTLINTACTAIPSSCAGIFGYYSPLWYGAKCDGVTHDEVGFQAALTAAITASATLQLPPGDCVLNANITNSGLFLNVTIQGFGNISKITFLNNFGFNFPATASYYNLQNFNLRCALTSTNPCLALTDTSQSTAYGSIFRNITIDQCGLIGMSFRNLVQAFVLNNWIIIATGATAAIVIDNTETPDTGGNIVQNNQLIGSNTTYGIHYLNAGGTDTISNNIAGFAYGIRFDLNLASGASTGILMQGNQVDNIGTGGIWFESGLATGAIVHVNVSHNTVRCLTSGPGSGPCAGINFNAAPSSVIWVVEAVIAANVTDTFQGNGGILVNGGSTYTINGNSISDQATTSNAGIFTDGATCVVVGNVISQYTTHVSNGAGCTLAGNN